MQTQSTSQPPELVDAHRFDEGLAPPMPESFGRRLRAVRERQRVSIAAIAESTKILGALLEGLENDDVSRWPTGLYRRAFIRAYATAIGLDPEPIVREFIARFPDHEEAGPPAAPVPTPAPRAVLRLTLAEPVGLPGATIGQVIARRVIATAADVMVLSVLGASLYAVLGDFWPPLTMAAITYYVAGVLVLGNTPGVCLAAATAKGVKGRDPYEHVQSEAEPRRRLPMSRARTATTSRPALRLGFRAWSGRALTGWQEWLSRH